MDGIQMSVHIQRGFDVGVPQLFLGGQNIHACLIQNGGERVPQPMGGDVRDDHRDSAGLHLALGWGSECAVLEIQLFEVAFPHPLP